MWFGPAVYLGSNPVTLAGAVLTTSSAITLIGFWAFDILVGGDVNPYAGLLVFLILPGFFVAGLVLMPIGALWKRRQLARSGNIVESYPRVDLSSGTARHLFAWISGLTLLNIMIFGAASYRGVEYMDSAKFCGQTRHTVMQP